LLFKLTVEAGSLYPKYTQAFVSINLYGQTDKYQTKFWPGLRACQPKICFIFTFKLTIKNEEAQCLLKNTISPYK
jgi:hypothetical protein